NGVMSGGSCAVRNCSGRRSCESNGARAASVNTACPPACRRAALVSMPRIAAWACGLRTNAASSVPAKRRSSTKRPAPVSSGRSSIRLTGLPIYRVCVTRLELPQPENSIGGVGVHQSLADQVAQRLGGPAAEAAVTGAAIEPRHQVFVGEAVAAEHLDGLAGDADRHLVAIDLG